MLDSLQRQHPRHPRSTGKRVDLSERDLKVLERLSWYPKLPTAYLRKYYDLWGHAHSGDRISDLGSEENTRHGGKYLDRPEGQWPPLTYIDRKFHLTHELSDAGIAALKEVGRYQPFAHGGPYYHQLMNSCVGADLDLGAMEAGMFALPRHLCGNVVVSNLEFSFFREGDSRSGKYVMDYKPDDRTCFVFPSGKRRHAIIEYDRATESMSRKSFTNEKSILRMVVQMVELLGTDKFRRAYEIPQHEGMFGIIYTTTQKQFDAIIKTIDEVTGGCNYLAVKLLPQYAGKGGFIAPKPDAQTFLGPYARCNRPDFYLAKEERQ
jgi:hypothetical protein